MEEDLKKMQKKMKEEVIVPVDACSRPLEIPNRFVPYLEKHRIYELMHQVASDLIIKLPKDHIKCIKDSLEQIQVGRDYPRIIIIAPPFIDKRQLAERMCFELKATLFSLNDIIEAYTSCDFCKDEIPTEIIAETAVRILQSHLNKGWIFYDIPRNRTEAYALQRAGFLPTHTLHLICPSLYEAAGNLKKFNYELNENECYERMKTYRRHSLGIRYIFQSTLREIFLDGRSLDDLATDAADLCQTFRHLGQPMLPRIVIIGSRGSGRRLLCQALAQRFHLVLVDFEYTLSQALEEDSVFGDKLRSLGREGLEEYPELLISIVEQRLTQWDCLDNGWILLGFPRNVDEMRLIDLIDTCPNRVLILVTPLETCIERLVNRRYNKYTGQVCHVKDLIPDDETNFDEREKLPTCPLKNKTSEQISPEKVRFYERHATIHPRDQEDVVKKEVTEQYTALRGIHSYCGRSATVLDGSLNRQHIFERASGAIIKMAPAAPPRDPIADTYNEEVEIKEGTLRALEMLLAKKLPDNRYRWAKSAKFPDDRDLPPISEPQSSAKK